MTFRLFLCALITITAAVASADKIDDWAKTQMAAKHIPGMVIGVYRHGKPVKTGAYGFADLENSVPVKRNSIFEICSITKQFTAAAVLLLAEDGKLTLDDPVSKHITDWPKPWQSVTIRQLLNHTSGINDDLYGDWEKPLPEVLKLMMPTTTVPADQVWEYSNFCYMIAGQIVGKVSGKGYYEFLQQRIFDRLGMKDTHPNNTHSVVPHRVRGYSWTGKSHENQPWLSQELGLGDGGLLSTMDDLNIWSEALKHDRLLKPASRAIMLTPGKVGGDSAWPEGMGNGYGLGVILAGTPQCRIEKHSGGWADASAQLTRLLEDDTTVVVLTNFGGWGERMYIGEAIAELISPNKYLPRWDVQPNPEPARLKAIETIFASVVRKLDLKDLVTERMAKGLTSDGTTEAFKKLDVRKFQFVKRVPQGSSNIYVYRNPGETDEIQWFLFDATGKLANLGSFPIIK